MQFTHYQILAAANIVYSSRTVNINEFCEAQQVLKFARANGYRFNAYGHCISHTPEQCAQAIAADQIWASLQELGHPAGQRTQWVTP